MVEILECEVSDSIAAEIEVQLNGFDGLNAYEIAVKNGFDGNEQDWLAFLKGDKGDQGNKGDKGDQGDKGDRGDKGEKGNAGERGEKGETGTVGPKGADGLRGEDGKNPYIGANGNWYVGDTDTGVLAYGKPYIDELVGDIKSLFDNVNGEVV